MSEFTPNQSPAKLEHAPKKRFDLIAFLRKLLNPSFNVKKPSYSTDLSPQLETFNTPRQRQQRAARKHPQSF